MKQINITLSHEDYEKIKPQFAVIRRKHHLTYLFGKSGETEDVLHHEWQSDKDEIYADYIIDKIKSTAEKKEISAARITYKFEPDSVFYKDMIGLLYSVVSHIEETQSSQPSSQIELSNEEVIRASFLFDMRIDIDAWDKYEKSNYNPVLMPERKTEFSDYFIIRTLEAIKKGEFKGRGYL